MEPLNLDGPMKRIARKHGIDLSKLNFQEIIDTRDEREEQESIRFTRISNQVKKRRLFNSSLISDLGDLNQTFNDFKIIDAKQKLEFDKARNIAERILNGETGNYTFAGNAGSGKSMLAISILNYINQNSDVKSCYFASFSILVNENINGIHDPGQRRDALRTERCIKNCDVLVLDDLGSETAMKSDAREASDYTQSLLFRIADYRKSKVNIVTTNNSSKELQAIYNSKIYSRLIAKKANNAIRFDSKDMRNI